jgi:poly(glycerol-phosphate) alpha-glucosyltransferase
LEPRARSVWGPDAVGYAPGLVDALLDTGADLLHRHALWMYPSWAGLRWARRTGNPYVVSVHGMLDPWALDNARWKKWVAGRLFEDAALRRSACLHALNDEEYRSIRAYGLDGPVCVVPNGVDLPAREDPALPPPWAETFGPEAPVLLFLGRIHPKKGLAELVDGWAAAADALGDWRLAIVGWDDGDHVPALRQRIQDRGLEDRVAFLGPRYGDEKDAAFRHAGGFVLPSHSEGLPMAVLEAWAYELPVLMTRACNLSAGFEAGAAHEIAPDPSSIAEGLRALAQASATERRAMGRTGRRLVEDRYTWPQIARSMRAVYRWVLGEGDRPDCVRLD